MIFQSRSSSLIGDSSGKYSFASSQISFSRQNHQPRIRSESISVLELHPNSHILSEHIRMLSARLSESFDQTDATSFGKSVFYPLVFLTEILTFILNVDSQTSYGSPVKTLANNARVKSNREGHLKLQKN